MTQIHRRRVLQLSGASAAAAATGGLAGILASGRAPAYGQTQTVHWLRWADFVPASDVYLKGPFTEQCQKDLGIKLTVETINANDIQARVTSAIQSGAGPDIFYLLQNWPQLYGQSCVDVSDIAEEIGKAQGGFYDICKVVGTMGGKWIGVPFCVGGGLVAYRKSWLAEAGSPDGFPKDWDTYRAVGKKLKAANRPYGQTAGHTFGDAPGWWYPYMWSWGGKEVEADGKTVVLNSKETVESVKFAVALWKETMDEGGLSWDDTNNNRAFLSGTISATNNGASIYIEAKKKPDAYQTEKGDADVQGRHPARQHPRRRRRHVQRAWAVHQLADEVFEEPGRGQEIPRLGPLQAGFRGVVHVAAGLHRRRHQGLRGRPGVERRSGAGAVQEDPDHRPAGRICRPAEPEGRRGAAPSTSSSTCTRRRSRAWIPPHR